MSVQYSLRDRGAWLKLDRPAAMNAIDESIVGGLEAGLDQAARDSARCIVIHADGRAFCAGADLAYVRERLARGESIVPFLRRFGDVLRSLAEYPGPTIAAINGIAVAGGFELVLACDLVIAARSAQLGDGHAVYGLIPGAGSAARLPRLVGATRAKHLLFTGDMLDPAAMQQLGVVTEVVDDDLLEERAEQLCRTLAARSAAGLARCKAIADHALDLPLEEALALELRHLEAHLASADVTEGLEAFAQRRSPKFTSVPGDVTPP